MNQITWLLSLFPDWVWALLTIAGVLALLASWVLKFVPFVNQYRLPMQVAGVLALLVGVYFNGVVANEAKWKERIAEAEKQTAKAEQESRELNEQLAKALEEKKQLQEQKNKKIVKYIDKWRTKEILKEVQGPERVRVEEVIKYIESCPVPKEMIDIHNEAAKKGDRK